MTFWKPFFLEMAKKHTGKCWTKMGSHCNTINSSLIFSVKLYFENDSYAATIKSYLSSSLSELWTLSVVKNKSLIILSIVFSKGTLVNGLSAYKLVVQFTNFTRKWKWTVYSSSVKGFKIGTRNLSKLCVWQPYMSHFEGQN